MLVYICAFCLAVLSAIIVAHISPVPCSQVIGTQNSQVQWNLVNLDVNNPETSGSQQNSSGTEFPDADSNTLH